MTCLCLASYLVLPPIIEPAWTLQFPSLISDRPLEACEGRLTTTVSCIFNTFVKILFSIVSSNFLSCGFEIFISILPFSWSFRRKKRWVSVYLLLRFIGGYIFMKFMDVCSTRINGDSVYTNLWVFLKVVKWYMTDKFIPWFFVNLAGFKGI